MAAILPIFGLQTEYSVTFRYPDDTKTLYLSHQIASKFLDFENNCTKDSICANHVGD